MFLLKPYRVNICTVLYVAMSSWVEREKTHLTVSALAPGLCSNTALNTPSLTFPCRPHPVKRFLLG